MDQFDDIVTPTEMHESVNCNNLEAFDTFFEMEVARANRDIVLEADRLAGHSSSQLFDPYSDKMGFKILSAYLNDMYKISQAQFSKIWAKYPESGRAYSMTAPEKFQAEIINIANGYTTQISLVNFNMKKHPSAASFFKRTFGDNLYIDDMSTISQSMIQWFNSHIKIGTLSYEDETEYVGTFMVDLNMNKLRSFLVSKGIKLNEQFIPDEDD